MDRRNIRETVLVRCFGDKSREARLRNLGHVQRRDSECIGKRMLRLELSGRRPRGRRKRRFMVKENMKLVAVKEEEVKEEDMVSCRYCR